LKTAKIGRYSKREGQIGKSIPPMILFFPLSVLEMTTYRKRREIIDPK
jgi:hypothetical protein